MALKSIACWTYPLFSIHAVYLISAIFEQVSWCVLYLEGCTSISEAGRHNPANYVFCATMIPWAVILMIYWTLVSKWLIAMRDKKGFVNRAILFWGIGYFSHSLCNSFRF